jgi:hypothetical protein
MDLPQQHSKDITINDLILERTILRILQSLGMIVVRDTHLFDEFRKLILSLTQCPETMPINRCDYSRNLQCCITTDVSDSFDVLHAFISGFCASLPTVKSVTISLIFSVTNRRPHC